MENSQTENAPSIQIRHDVDGWFYQPLDYDIENKIWLYGCPHCGDMLTIQKYVPIVPSESPVSLSDTPTPETPQEEPSEVPVKRRKGRRSVESEAIEQQQP